MDILNSFLVLYNLQNSNSILISNRINIVYKIEANNQAYTLKICSPKAELTPLINEVEWLQAIREDTNLLVPRPLPNQQGQMISQLEDRFCILFEWLDGEPIPQYMSIEVARQIGEMMAQLHLHASKYSPKKDIVNRLDNDYFFGSSSWWETTAQEYLLDSYQDFVPAANKAKKHLKSLNKFPEHFGLIHSDIHLNNLIIKGNSLRIIDFGLCSLGYYFMDIALIVLQLKRYRNGEQLISSFRKGYQSLRECFPSSEDLKIFEVMLGLCSLKRFHEITQKNGNKYLQEYFIYITMRVFWSLGTYKVLKYFIHKGLIFLYIQRLVKRVRNWYSKLATRA